MQVYVGKSKIIHNIVMKSTLQQYRTNKCIFFQHSPPVFITLVPALHKLMYAFEEKYFQSGGKPCVHCLQLMVTGKMMASSSTCDGPTWQGQGC
jgi:hypothetical protein